MNRVSSATVHGRKNDFIRATCAGYLARYLRKGHPMDGATMVFLAWAMGSKIEQVEESRLKEVHAQKRSIGF